MHPTIAGWGHFDQDRWELYHTDVDPTEMHDLAEREPAKLQEMIARVVQESALAAPKPPVEEPNPLLQKLTQREQEVLSYIVQGLTNKEIATQLFLSPDTVKNHVVHIMEKLGAQDRTQAAVIAIRNGLIK